MNRIKLKWQPMSSSFNLMNFSVKKSLSSTVSSFVNNMLLVPSWRKSVVGPFTQKQKMVKKIREVPTLIVGTKQTKFRGVQIFGTKKIWSVSDSKWLPCKLVCRREEQSHQKCKNDWNLRVELLRILICVSI